ncbi:GNAT family N-acetyltransferase [Microbacterium sp. ZW T5_56]|uniref:GNAT family N-acetyltransferase n=1 Tax=Microbacterium sp. ZW T5_56 TaxID=3378081 RepID=UPI00385204F9
MAVYEFSADPARIDIDRTHRWIAEESYWGQDRARERHVAAIANSRAYGVYEAESGEQVGFARIITDGITFAWLCDVFVDPERRGEGIGKRLMAGITAELEPLALRRVMLITADAHGLYASYGFEPLDDPAKFMARA